MGRGAGGPGLASWRWHRPARCRRLHPRLRSQFSHQETRTQTRREQTHLRAQPPPSQQATSRLFTETPKSIQTLVGACEGPEINDSGKENRAGQLTAQPRAARTERRKREDRRDGSGGSTQRGPNSRTADPRPRCRSSHSGKASCWAAGARTAEQPRKRSPTLPSWPEQELTQTQLGRHGRGNTGTFWRKAGWGSHGP